MIPLKIRKKLSEDPRMKMCHICKNPNVEWHHSVQYAGKSLQKEYAIIALCVRHHRGQFGTISNEVKEKCELEAIRLSEGKIEVDCPKRDWKQRLKYLQSKYGKGKNNKGQS